MAKNKKNHSTTVKSKVALAAIQETLSINQITSEYGVHATQIKNWREQALEAIKDCFSKKREREKAAQNELIEKLYTEIGQLQTQLNWLKKKCKTDS